jgi:uncharacterized protein YndB with AHSA1/START domain
VSEFGVSPGPGVVCFERLLPGPIERVWSYLVDSDKRGKWFAAGETEPRAGGNVEFRFKHADLSPIRAPIPEKFKEMENGHVSSGKVTRYEPPRLLAFDWLDEDGTSSEVVFELSQQGNDVLLVLTHHRLKDRQEMLNVAGGWHTHLAILEDNLRGVTPRPFWSAHEKIDGEYDKRLP